MKRGDIFSIETSKGQAYFQFSRNIAPMGSLIRVLPGIYLNESPAWEMLVEQKTNFWIFFPVAAAAKQGIVHKVANRPLPDHATEIPIFRTGVVDPSTGKVETWWLWDGSKSWMIGALNEEQRMLPIRGSWNDTLLVQRIEEGWRPEKDSR